jgi:dTDP-glucose 4,6-dehydratase
MYGKLLYQDLIEIEDVVSSILDPLKEKRILLFGGTGFLGLWISTALLFLNERHDLKTKIVIVTRNRQEAHLKFPGVDLKDLEFIEFNLKCGLSLDLSEFDIFINGPTPSTRKSLGSDFNSVFFPARVGAELIARSAHRYGNVPQVLNLSSGAVYGKSRTIDQALVETDTLVKSKLSNYQKDKIFSEESLQVENTKGAIRLLNLRLFAFLGPLLSLDEHFAVGNFFNDAIAGRAIRVRGNPNTKRSYLYPIDFMIAVLRLVVCEAEGSFNLGGSHAITMDRLATIVNSQVSNSRLEVVIDDLEEANFYYPNTLKIREVLGDYESVSVERGIDLWANWYRQNQI